MMLLMRIASSLVLFAATAAAAEQPLFRVVDLDVGATEKVQLANGKSAVVKLIGTADDRDKVRSAIRDARVELEVNGTRTTLSCGNYHLPVTAGGAQVDCSVTKAYYRDTNSDHWALQKDARVRIWPAGSPWMPPGSFVYPVRQRWFATRTQMANEPTYVDGGESISSRKIYYHSGLDIGGAEGLTEVVAATNGTVVALGKAAVESEKNNKSLDRRFDETIWVLDERGWYHRYTHLYSYDPSVTLGGTVKMGQKIATLGKEGSSGGWSHLHYEILGPQASGRLGTVEGYAFLWEAWQRQNKPRLTAVARPHRAALRGETVTLDASLSFADSPVSRFEWVFTNGERASGVKVQRTYSQAGTYSEMLKITDSAGRTDYDFMTVDVLDPERPRRFPRRFRRRTGRRSGSPRARKSRSRCAHSERRTARRNGTSATARRLRPSQTAMWCRWQRTDSRAPRTLTRDPGITSCG